MHNMIGGNALQLVITAVDLCIGTVDGNETVSRLRGWFGGLCRHNGGYPRSPQDITRATRDADRPDNRSRGS